MDKAGTTGNDLLLIGNEAEKDRLDEWTVPCTASIADAGAEAVIPSKRSRSQAIPHDKHLYKERNLVERFINKIKHYRRVATRYEKTVVSFAAVLFLVATMVWLK